MNRIELAHVANRYHRYPGETAIFFTRLTVLPGQPLKGSVTVKINLPPGAAVTQAQGPPGHGDARTFESGVDARNRTVADRHQVVFWRVPGGQLYPGQSFEYRTTAAIDAASQLRTLGASNGSNGTQPLGAGQSLFQKSWAEVEVDQGPESQVVQSTVARIQISLQAHSLKYLPGIYQDEQQELLWRYLMLFDSCWSQFENRLGNMPFYFDPHLAPPDFVPWLASWVGLVWDTRLPKIRRQNLIPFMVELYRKRGTKRGLQQYLQLCMGVSDAEADQRIKIEENPVGNFILGDEIELGDLILGEMEEELCQFIVTLDWTDLPRKLDEALVREIIEAWKPAHTVYQLST